MPGATSPGEERVRAAELIAALSLATDLALGMELEHGLRSTIIAARLSERLGADGETAAQAYYACLLFYVGCTADAEVAADTFGSDDALRTHFAPVMFGSRLEIMAGIMRALATPGSAPPARAAQVVRRLPRALAGHRSHIAAMCEVAEMLTDRLGMPASVQRLFAGFTERWDGKGEPGVAKGEEIPLPVRIAHVARDADLQHTLGGVAFAGRVIGERAGSAFDPAIAALVTDDPAGILTFDPAASTPLRRRDLARSS